MIFCLSHRLFSTTSAEGNQTPTDFTVNIENRDNQTFILHYNVTTNDSYYITFRLFGHEQLKLGLFSPKSPCEQSSVTILEQYRPGADSTSLYIVCFHFLRSPIDIDIQCRDIRLATTEVDSRPSYKPLFVPMMYALSVLMLLPVIIQHRRHKQAQLSQRHKALRRLSINIMQDNPDLLPRCMENGKLDPKKIPIQIELLSFPSTRTIMDDIDDNDNVTFTLQNGEPFHAACNGDKEEFGVTADDCIAHLLDNAPWNTDYSEKVPLRSSMREQQVPMLTSVFDPPSDRPSSSKSDVHCTVQLFRSNPAFIESDV